MLIAHDRSFAICTPTKCGTNSLQQWLKPYCGLITPHHRCDSPHEIPIRLLAIRPGPERFESIYRHFLQVARERHQAPQFQIAHRGLRPWADQYFQACDNPTRANPKTYTWHYSLQEIAEVFRPTELINLFADPQHVRDRLSQLCGISLPELPHANQSGIAKEHNLMQQLGDLWPRLKQWSQFDIPRVTV